MFLRCNSQPECLLIPVPTVGRAPMLAQPPGIPTSILCLAAPLKNTRLCTGIYLMYKKRWLTIGSESQWPGPDSHEWQLKTLHSRPHAVQMRKPPATGPCTPITLRVLQMFIKFQLTSSLTRTALRVSINDPQFEFEARSLDARPEWKERKP
jgi:hypothetical protein